MMKGTLLILLSIFLNITMQSQVLDEQKIISGERKANAQFGSAVDIYTDYAIVGEPYSHTDENLTDSIKEAGAAFIFKKDSEGKWVKTQKLVAPDREERGRFGYDVTIYDTTVLIGSDKDKVYVFEKNTDDIWVYKQTISEADGQEFGLKLSMHNNYAIIGDTYAWGTFSGGYKYPAGAAYIYERDETGVWVKSKKVMASDYAKYDNFGETVDIYNDYAIVGNSNHDNSRGAAYLYHRSPEGVWSQAHKLEAPSPETWDAYAKTVAITDSVVVVGSIGEDYDAEDNNYVADAGAIFIYNIISGDTCTFSEKITAPERNANWDYFGSAIDLSDNYLIVAAGKEDEDSNEENTLADAGAIYIFEKNSSGKWGLNSKITPADRTKEDLFGHAVAMYQENFIIGAPQGDLDLIAEDSISNAGGSYIYKLQTLPGLAVQPVDKNNICSGSEIAFSVIGSRIENYQWMVSPNDGETWTNITNDTIYSGATTDSLLIKTHTDLDNLQYYCKVSNSFGTLNSDTVSLTITIDSEAPQITSTHNDQAVDANENCEAILPDYTDDIVATDDCDTDLAVTQNPVAGTIISGATNAVTLKVIDDAGNETLVSFNVAVEDNTAPIITSSHSYKTIYTETSCEVILPDYTGRVVATDICDADLDITQSPVAGTSISGTSNAVKLIVTDDAGNTDEVTINVSVKDNTPPTITCPDNKTVSLSEGQTAYTVSGTEFDPIAIDDNCGIASTINSLNYLSTLNGLEIPVGTYTATWTVTDNESYENTCNFKITVNQSTTSISTLQQYGISIYPNPTNGILNLDYANINAKALIISDLSGKHVFEKMNINEHEIIDLSVLNKGIYVLSIQTENEVYTTRIIKE